MSASYKIPIIDMSPYLEDGCQKVAQEIYSAAHEVGFIYLKNFGMSEDIDRTPNFVPSQMRLLPDYVHMGCIVDSGKSPWCREGVA